MLWAVVMQPRLWATMTTGRGCSSTVFSSRATQAERVGVMPVVPERPAELRQPFGHSAFANAQWPGIPPAGHDDDGGGSHGPAWTAPPHPLAGWFSAVSGLWLEVGLILGGRR